MRKALLVPVNDRGEILIQDRRGYKKPDWGYFGGSIEGEEGPEEAVIREAKEELDLSLSLSDIIFLGKFLDDHDGIRVEKHFFAFKTSQEEFVDLEAQGAKWVSFDKAKELLSRPDRVDRLIEILK